MSQTVSILQLSYWPSLLNIWSAVYICDPVYKMIHWIVKKQENAIKSICLIVYTKAFDCVDHNCGKFLKSWEYQTTLPAPWEICMPVRKQKLELDMEQWIGSKLGQEDVKAVYCQPAYLTYMQSTSCKMPG